MSRFRPIADERGLSFPELAVSLLMGTVLMLAAFSMLQEVNRSTARTVARIDANQQARPVMERLMDELRSTCLARGTVPIQTGSTGSQLRFLHEIGTDVAPVPDLRTVTWDSTARTLVENAYAANPTTPNAQGVFSFPSFPAGPPLSSRPLLRNVTQATIDGSVRNVFRYYRYTNGALAEITTLPLSATDAALVVQVVVSFETNPFQNPTGDARAGTAVTGTALLRFGPPSETATTPNLPCT